MRPFGNEGALLLYTEYNALMEKVISDLDALRLAAKELVYRLYPRTPPP